MKYTSINIDVETLRSKYYRHQINLDAAFQRGEVWNVGRKKKLIDTMLREWPIPPVQFLILTDGSFEVLDGLQRITTIISFLKGEIKIDASIRPSSEEIGKLDGMTFYDIEKKVKDNFCIERDFFSKIYNRILNISISVYQIYEATPEEIAELFERFNSPMLLNTVEKRNAFFGITRNQINDLKVEFESLGASKDTIGFSNIRGSYEDIIAKICYSLDFPPVNKKIVSDDLLNLYRSNYEFTNETLNAVECAMKTLMTSIHTILSSATLKLPRAAVFSFLLFIAVNQKISQSRLSEILYYLYINEKTSFSILRRLFEENTSIASTDARSIKTRQYVLKLLSDELFSISEIEKEHKDEYRIIEDAERFNYITNEFER